MLRLAIALVVAFAAPWPGCAQAQAVLTADALRAAAVAALDADAIGDARQFAEALLQRDPADVVARTILTRIAFAADDPAAARAQAAALWRASDDPDQRYDAARLAALAAAEEGRFTLSQFWLRRALTVAPDAAALQQTVADFRAVRDRNPWTLNLGLAISPSDNVTGGTDVEVIEIDGEPLYLGPLPLSPSAIDRAYGGVAFSPDIRLSYRLRQEGGAQTSIWGLVQGRTVVLSDAALRDLEGEEYEGEQITARDFSFAQALVGVQHETRTAGAGQTWSAHLGRVWQRGEHSEDLANIGYSRQFRLDPRSALILAGNLEYRWHADDPDRDSLRRMLRVRHVQVLENAMRLRLDLSLTEATSDHDANNYTRLTLGAAVTPDDVLPGIDLTLRASTTFTRFPDYAFFDPIPGGREDRQIALGVDMTFDRFSYAGFSPTLSIEAQRTESNVNQFESAGVDFNFGIVSSF